LPASDATAPNRRLTAYVGAVCASGLVALVALVYSAPSTVDRRPSLVFLLLGVVLVLGELRPILIARGDEEGDEVTISSTFALALVIAQPLVLAVTAQLLAVVIDDVRRRKSLMRIWFNGSQYTLTLAAARTAYAAASGRPVLNAAVSFRGVDIGAALFAGLVFFVVNNGVTGVVVALDRGSDVLHHLREDVKFQASTSGVLLSFAPVVVSAVDFSPWLLPLLLMPIAAVHRSASLAVDRERQALTDTLTGLPNRVLLHDRITRLLLERSTRPLAVMLIDLDHFKEINDTLGHHVGDELIREVALRLRDALRDGDTVARLGGDEFAVVAASIHSADDAVVVAERLVLALREPFTIDGVRLDVQASIGIAVSPAHGSEVKTLIQRADVALYTAKEDRGCWAMYQPEEDIHSVERLALLGELRVGLETGQLDVFYQPKSEARTGLIVGVEALVRWHHPTRGMLPPDEFIPLAENTGLIGELTLYVLERALDQARTWRLQGLPLGVAVNLSPRQLTDLDLPRQIAGVLGAHGLPPEVLTLEVTESTIMADPSRTLAVLALLRELGVCISVDDFGTGYSSLSHLKRLQAHELKIDKSFVLGMSANSNDAVIVRSTIELGHNLGLRLVAEGVEDAETWRLLRSLGCDVIQGYYLSRPRPADELTPWLIEHDLRFQVDSVPAA
jgi:diguanylate cyclase (GGDEF)-like protein